MAGCPDTEQDEALVQGYKTDVVTLLENERTALFFDVKCIYSAVTAENMQRTPRVCFAVSIAPLDF